MNESRIIKKLFFAKSHLLLSYLFSFAFAFSAFLFTKQICCFYQFPSTLFFSLKSCNENHHPLSFRSNVLETKISLSLKFLISLPPLLLYFFLKHSLLTLLIPKTKLRDSLKNIKESRNELGLLIYR